LSERADEALLPPRAAPAPRVFAPRTDREARRPLPLRLDAVGQVRVGDGLTRANAGRDAVEVSRDNARWPRSDGSRPRETSRKAPRAWHVGCSTRREAGSTTPAERK